MLSKNLIRIATVIRSRLECDGIDAILKSQAEFQPLGSVTSADQFAELCQRLSPDVGIVDVTIPFAKADMFAVASQLIAQPAIKYVLFLDDFPNELRVRQALEIEASGYITRGAGCEKFVAAISDLAAGRWPTIPAGLDDQTAAGLPARHLRLDDPAWSHSALEKLTSREIQVLQLMAEGRTAAECANLLNISASTVDNHKSNLMKKLDMHRQTQLVRFAIRTGLTVP